jgi:hypothetical protein
MSMPLTIVILYYSASSHLHSNPLFYTEISIIIIEDHMYILTMVALKTSHKMNVHFQSIGLHGFQFHLIEHAKDQSASAEAQGNVVRAICISKGKAHF